MVLSLWGALRQGKLQMAAEEACRKEMGEKGQLLYNYVQVQSEWPVTCDTLGPRRRQKVKYLEANLKALQVGISLSKERIEFLESTVPFGPGFPMIGDGSSYSFLLASVAKLAKQPGLQPVMH
ncbi:hypothetical protein F5146DRAFT_1002255 [Armillaria mellea]|nr:hypothetical protein F5146DRAFT_1002255 [Armillaria mellea]